MDQTNIHHNHHHSSINDDHQINSTNSVDVNNMLMYLHGGFNEIVLFNFWKTENFNTFILSCILWLLIAITAEWLKMFRRKLITTELHYKEFFNTKIHHMELVNETPMTRIQEPKSSSSISTEILSCSHFFQTILYFIQVLISYSLMLVVMTFNVWLCLSVAIGSAIGYFIFGRQEIYENHH